MSKMTVRNITPGTTGYYNGEPCLVLEHREDGTLLLDLNEITYEFGSSNNFATSDLRDYLNGAYLNTLTKGQPGDVLPRTVDLTALNGSKEYGTCECQVAPLTVDELRKYHDLLRKTEQKKWEWSVTPWSTPQVNGDESWVMGLDSNGGVYSNYCTLTFGSRPAFLIPSNTTVDDNEDTEGLSQYTSEELLEELHRRLTQRDA
jgi:hypothetical protein